MRKFNLILIVFLIAIGFSGSVAQSYASGVIKINPYYDSPQIKQILSKDYPKFIKINLIAVSEIGLYRYESGRYLLCVNSI